MVTLRADVNISAHWQAATSADTRAIYYIDTRHSWALINALYNIGLQ
jgi:hypothetical protein